jgi:hypothetical protein
MSVRVISGIFAPQADDPSDTRRLISRSRDSAAAIAETASPGKDPELRIVILSPLESPSLSSHLLKTTAQPGLTERIFDPRSPAVVVIVLHSTPISTES